ncbi:hypothetical protein BZA77DRAFT_303069 [Pyronema omphalodes]|nr:hypothetical protein BZA77DRAFT_303069 [Pyronema omphalodes]
MHTWKGDIRLSGGVILLLAARSVPWESGRTTGERPNFISERNELRLALKLPDLTLDSRPSCRSRDAPTVDRYDELKGKSQANHPRTITGPSPSHHSYIHTQQHIDIP